MTRYTSQVFVTFFTVFLLSGSGSLCAAKNIWVDSPSDLGICGCSVVHTCCSLRNAISTASSGDTVTFRQSMAGSTITLTGGELTLDKTITIDGDLDDDGNPDITVSTDTESRILKIEDSTIVSLDGLVIRDGNPPPAYYGAGISIGIGAFITLKNSVISNNGDWRGAWNLRGGGVYNFGSLLIDNCEFISNYAYEGGAIFNESVVVITNSNIRLNHGKIKGGGFHNTAGSTLGINRTKIYQNNLEKLIGDPDGQVGAGIYNVGNLTINDSVIESNSIIDYSVPGPFFPKYGSAGGMYNNGQATIRRTLFENNSAANGGGLMNAEEIVVESSTFYRNSADSGGAIYNSTVASSSTSHETMVIRNSTIYENSADADGGGGIYMAWASGPDGEHITNTIIAGNDYYSGGDDCHIVAGRGSLETNGNNLIEDGTCFPSMSGNPRIQDLKSNGGFSETLAITSNSPAYNAGNNAYFSVSMTTDQRGSGYPRIREGVVDIGAFELSRYLSFPVRNKDGGITIISF